MTIASSSAESIDTIALTTLQRRMRGDLLTPGAPSYDAARRLANRRFDVHPALIARCHSAQDVAYAVDFAREYNLEIAVRSGGHSVPGHSAVNGGMMIDLSQLRQISVDPVRRTAHVGPGTTNGELVHALTKYGFATTTGTCASVGMGGSTLGGGIGWLMGRFGATIDNVLAFEVVTADGELITASADQHPDLFWALRGGGGNFGIVTEITYRVHRLDTVLGGMLLFPLAAAAPALRQYYQLTSAAPDHLIAHALLATIPEIGPALIVQACYSGEDLAEGERVLAPLRRFPSLIADLIIPRSYAELYMMLTPPTMPDIAYYDAAYTLRQSSNAAIEAQIACAQDQPSPFAMINIHQFHGAATRVAPDATAFALREPHYAVLHAAAWVEGTGEPELAWVQQSYTRMKPFASSGVYVNFLGEEGDDAVRQAYRANYTRLALVKTHYDPANIFHRNQNIRPR